MLPHHARPSPTLPPSQPSHLLRKLPSSSSCLPQFEHSLSRRLSALDPSLDTGFLSFAWLSRALALLVAVLGDLDAFVAQLELPLSRKEEKIAAEFLDACVRGLDICNAVRGEIAMAEARNSQVKLVVEVLNVGEGRLSEAQVRRTKKVLADYREIIRAGNEDDGRMKLKATLKSRGTDGLEGSQENHFLKTATVASRHFRVLSGKFLNHKVLGRLGSGELITASNCISAIYGVNLITTFLLSTVLASLSGNRGFLSLSPDLGRRYLWSSPLQKLQEKVAEEISKRGKRGEDAVLWELDQMSVCLKHLSDLVDCLLTLKKFPLLQVQEEEMRNTVKQLKKQQEEQVENGFKLLDQQTAEVYRRLLFTRSNVSNKLSRFEA